MRAVIEGVPSVGRLSEPPSAEIISSGADTVDSRFETSAPMPTVSEPQ
jgi:hypothetical protein